MLITLNILYIKKKTTSMGDQTEMHNNELYFKALGERDPNEGWMGHREIKEQKEEGKQELRSPGVSVR